MMVSWYGRSQAHSLTSALSGGRGVGVTARSVLLSNGPTSLRHVMPRIAVIFGVILPWAGSAWTQEATGHVEGRVLLQDATPAASVRVAATSPSLQLTRATETDVRGFFRLSALPVGSYRIRLALVGFRPVVFEGVSVRLGRTTSLGETQLQTAAFELAEITVRADRPLVDVTSAATVTNLPAEQFRNIPTGRNFRSIVKLAPQANTSYYPARRLQWRHPAVVLYIRCAAPAGSRRAVLRRVHPGL
jgi:Carboxypeptidase regulatory-like domain